jgi:hypothetical protein
MSNHTRSLTQNRCKTLDVLINQIPQILEREALKSDEKERNLQPNIVAAEAGKPLVNQALNEEKAAYHEDTMPL